jgi:hypothetical protein
LLDDGVDGGGVLGLFSCGLDIFFLRFVGVFWGFFVLRLFFLVPLSPKIR